MSTTTPMKISEADKEKFFKKVNKSGPDECWVWTSTKDTKGYGVLKTRFPCDKQRKMRKAHRMAWLIEHGYMPPSERLICHRCDNPSCVNPRHLFEGSNADNNRDMMQKGRYARDHPNRQGERHENARLTEKDVVEIRRLAAYTTSAELAKRFGVCTSHISKIALRQKWKHV